MEEKPPSNESGLPSLAEIDFPTGEGPKAHSVRFLDPREVESHFAPLLGNRPSPQQRWARKAASSPFAGL
jgi:hypothetical protein